MKCGRKERLRVQKRDKIVPRANRLRLKKDFRTVFNQGQRVRSESFSIIFLPSKQTRVGIVISKKTEKSAVKRNRTRRRVKEVLRKLLPSLETYSLDMVFLLGPEAVNKPFGDLKIELEKAVNGAVGFSQKSKQYKGV